MSAHAVAITQAAYYGLTGIWPLFSMNTFLKVTGPKVDLWLVRCVGLLIAVTALALFVAALYGEIGAAVRVLAVGDALALGVAETYYALRGKVSRIYLGDAVLEAGLIVAWALAR